MGVARSALIIEPDGDGGGDGRRRWVLRAGKSNYGRQSDGLPFEIESAFVEDIRSGAGFDTSRVRWRPDLDARAGRGDAVAWASSLTFPIAARDLWEGLPTGISITAGREAMHAVGARKYKAGTAWFWTR